MKGVFKYKDLLEGLENLIPIYMGEGETPLVKSRSIGPSLGFNNLYFKLESLNPTGSYKDRFGALAIAHLMANNKKICLATSSGNTGASLAAYTAQAGIPCHIAIVDGAPKNKLQQMQAYGAQLWMVKDFGIIDKKTNQVFKSLKDIANTIDTSIQVSAFAYSPFGMQGVQSISYEIAEELPEVKHVFVPSGGGGLILAILKGFEKWSETTKDFISPKTHCVQPKGNDTIASAIRNKKNKASEITYSTTHISGLQVPNIIDGHQVVNAYKRNNGTGFVVSDQSVFNWQKQLAQSEGIYCEPAAAVSMAGFEEALKEGNINPNEKVVCIITGHGFKDTAATEKMIADNQVNYINNTNEIKKHLKQL